MLALVERSSELARFDLTRARTLAEDAARHWRLRLGPPFVTANVSYVAPAGAAVVKVAWEGDDESLHEADALELWDGDGAMRSPRPVRSGSAGRASDSWIDLAALGEIDATSVAVELAPGLWRPARESFLPVVPAVRKWIAQAERKGSDWRRWRVNC